MSGLDTDRLAYRPREAAQVLGVSRSRVYELIQAGELRAIKLGANTLIRREALVELLDRLESQDGAA